MLTRWVAQASVILLLCGAGERSTCGAPVGVLLARDADVGHTSWAVGRAGAASHVVEVLSALGVPESSPLFAVVALVDGASTSAVRVRLVAVCAVVAELIWAALPADGTHAVVAIATLGVAQTCVLFLVTWAG